MESKLLTQAKIKYPVGIEYYNLETERWEIVEKQDFAEWSSNTIRAEPGKGLLYNNGTWAKVKPLTGRYVKVIDFFSSLINIGDVLKVLEDDSSNPFIKIEKYNVTKRDRLGKQLELLPLNYVHSEFKIGDYCYKHDFIFIKTENIPYKYNTALNTAQRKVFYPKNSAAISNCNTSPERFATQEEKNWLDACISAGKYVDNPKNHDSSPTIDSRYLIEGCIYVGEKTDGFKCIFKFEKDLNSPTHLINNKGDYVLSGSGCCTNSKIKFRLATSDEEALLNSYINKPKTTFYSAIYIRGEIVMCLDTGYFGQICEYIERNEKNGLHTVQIVRTLEVIDVTKLRAANTSEKAWVKNRKEENSTESINNRVPTSKLLEMLARKKQN